MTYVRFALDTTIIPTLSLIVNLVSPWWLQWIIGSVCLSVCRTCRSVCVFLCYHDNDTKFSNAKSQPQWKVWSSSHSTLDFWEIY